MGLTDEATTALHVSGLSPSCQARDLSITFSRHAPRQSAVTGQPLRHAALACAQGASPLLLQSGSRTLAQHQVAQHQVAAAPSAAATVISCHPAAAAACCLPPRNLTLCLLHRPPLLLLPRRSFGAIKAIRLGPAPGKPYEQTAEVYFASVAQATAALTALNAILVPRLSGNQPLEIQCWSRDNGADGGNSSGGSGPAAYRTAGVAAAAAAAAPVVPSPAKHHHHHQQRNLPLGPRQPQGVHCINPAEPAAAVELPGLEDLPSALEFLHSQCFLAVPGKPVLPLAARPPPH